MSDLPTLQPNTPYTAGTVKVEIVNVVGERVTLKFTVRNINGFEAKDLITLKPGDSMTIPFPMEWKAP